MHQVKNLVRLWKINSSIVFYIYIYHCTGSSKCSPPNEKAKSQLNILFQKHGITAKYNSRDDATSGNIHSFIATLTYTICERSYQYKSRCGFPKKQDAEEDAAQQALREVESQIKRSLRKGETSTKQYKSLLKEKYCDERQIPAPQYTTTEITSGGFVSTVNVPQYKPVRGAVGNSKKEAEQLAAMEALKQLKLLAKWLVSF